MISCADKFCIENKTPTLPLDGSVCDISGNGFFERRTAKKEIQISYIRTAY